MTAKVPTTVSTAEAKPALVPKLRFPEFRGAQGWILTQGRDGRDREERSQPEHPRYISTAVGEAEIDLDETHQDLVDIEKAIAAARDKHNGFLKELGLKLLP
jgi:hypothetical protein